MSEFPKYKYHPKHPAILVESAEQEALLNDAWKDTPAEFGVISCPSAKQTQTALLGFDPFAPEEKTETKDPATPRVRR